MCLPCASGVLGLAVRVKVQHDPRDLDPVGAVLLGVEQAEISDEILFVIAGKRRRARRFIGDIRSSGGFCMGGTRSEVIVTRTVDVFLPRRVDPNCAPRGAS